ncbi:Ribosome-releasing factor 2, mitochondrial [Trichinella britovi]|uniref:Ribosome-releasing factor 2, mitochondrial n=1 Tax=Trichinella britovi TaxID=45882 RepID=A0A0V1CA03_TRIBR|nr:Ribosome-releasing factor 2, mitochondrial [Trichinella britovi]
MVANRDQMYIITNRYFQAETHVSFPFVVNISCLFSAFGMIKITLSTVVLRRLMHTKLPVSVHHKVKRPKVYLDNDACDRNLDISKIRNIGLVAHIDAGKTTTTERMLYMSGNISEPGLVDAGTTTTDYMVQERERGITIASAIVSIYWAFYRLNLIDTPGHVDFTLEVERSLRVVDGALVILDGSEGVEAQTLTVWHQAEKFQIPSMVYINKLDKSNANLQFCLDSIRKLMKVEPLLINTPVFDLSGHLTGVTDLVRMMHYYWPEENGLRYDEKACCLEELNSFELKHRENLLSKLADLDDHFAEILLSDKEPSLNSADVERSLRQATIRRRVIPVLCGSSFRNRGIQPLLNAICQYLPSPLDCIPAVLQFYNGRLCCLAFKIVHDHYLGPLTYIRLYGGSLSKNSKVFNINRNCIESVTKIFIPHGDVMHEAEFASQGQIVVLPGLKSTIIGDTIVDSHHTAEHAKKLFEAQNVDSLERRDNQHPILAGIDVPEPVFYCTVEPSAVSEQNKLDLALTKLAREDPSIRTRIDSDSQQTILEAMGELHVEIIKDRLKRDYGLDVFLGPLQVNYRETVTVPMTCAKRIHDFVGSTDRSVAVELKVEPAPGAGPLKKVRWSHEQGKKALEDCYPQFILNSVIDGCFNACSHGPLLNSLVVDVDIVVQKLEVDRGVPVAAIAACTSQCLLEAMAGANSILLEPVSELKISIPANFGHDVLRDLNHRRAKVLDLNLDVENDVKCIHAKVPLQELQGYATCLRTLTSGMGQFHMIGVAYEPMTRDQSDIVLRRLTGMDL